MGCVTGDIERGAVLGPRPFAWGARVLMGWSMGSSSSRRFFTATSWFPLAVAGCTIAATALSAGLAWTLSAFTGRDTASVVPGTIP